MEKKYRLKYFYHINIDETIERIRKEKGNAELEDPQALAEIFYFIFQEVICTAKPYTEFILSDTPITHHSMFNENPYDPSVCSSYILASVALFHHCITHSFTNTIDTLDIAIAEKNTDTYPYNNEEFLTHSNHFKIRHGYFYNLIKSPDPENPGRIEKDQSNSYRRRHQKFYPDAPPKTYSEHYLKYRVVRSKESPNSYHKKHLAAETKFCNPALFLFKGPAIDSFDKELRKAGYNNFHAEYQKLHTSSIDWKSDLEYQIDHLLFDTIIEPCYAFNLMPYVNRLLTELVSDSWRDKPIHGTALIKIIADHLRPVSVTYNKGVLLKYAIDALRSCDTIHRTFPEPNTGRAVSYASAQTMPTDQFAATALLHLGEYFRMIQYVVIPVIEDLWDVLTAELGIDSAHFRKFVEDHWTFISYDYTLLPDDFILDLLGREEYTKTYEGVISRQIKRDCEHGIDVNSASYHPKADLLPVLNLPGLYSFKYYYEAVENIFNSQAEPLPHCDSDIQYNPQSAYLLKMLFQTPAKPVKELSDILFFESPFRRECSYYLNDHIGNLFNLAKNLS